MHKNITDYSSCKPVLTYPYIDVLQGCPEHLQLHEDRRRMHLCILYFLCPDKLKNAQFAMTDCTEQLYIHNLFIRNETLMTQSQTNPYSNHTVSISP